MEISTNIKEQFIKILKFSQNINSDAEMNVDRLLADWADAKEYFYEAFGHKLIWTSPEPMTFHLETKQRKFKYTCFVEKIETYWNNKKLARYLKELPPDDLFNNLVSSNVAIPNLDNVTEEPEYYKYKGMKLLKAFKYFEKDKNVLFDIQNEASRIIQEDKITGVLCFSIHPLDFLSLSENDHQWRSCHALDGDYRSGNLSYMIDTSTFICYLRSEDGDVHHLPNFPPDVTWNSKKWRRLLFLSNDKSMMFAGRPYPFALNNALNIITSHCNNFFCRRGEYWDDHWFHGGISVGWKDYEVFNSNDKMYLIGQDTLISDNQLIQEPEFPLFFNDLTESSCYIPYYTYKRHPFHMVSGYTTALTRFFIGKNVICPYCGERILEAHDVMVCNRCWKLIEEQNNRYHCSCCGNVVSDNLIMFVQNEEVCPDCYEAESSYCDNCGERYFNSDITYDRIHEMYLCPSCKQALENEEGETE